MTPQMAHRASLAVPPWRIKDHQAEKKRRSIRTPAPYVITRATLSGLPPAATALTDPPLYAHLVAFDVAHTQ